MPQATSALTAEWDGPSEKKAVAYLESRGYKLNRQYDWVKPPGLLPTEKDCSAVAFMFQEWDYGNIVDA